MFNDDNYGPSMDVNSTKNRAGNNLTSNNADKLNVRGNNNCFGKIEFSPTSSSSHLQRLQEGLDVVTMPVEAMTCRLLPLPLRPRTLEDNSRVTRSTFSVSSSCNNTSSLPKTTTSIIIIHPAAMTTPLRLR